MAFTATCDMCKRKITSLADIIELHEGLAIAGLVRYICKRCSRQLNRNVDKFGDYYKDELRNDIRDYIYDNVKK